MRSPKEWYSRSALTRMDMAMVKIMIMMMIMMMTMMMTMLMMMMMMMAIVGQDKKMPLPRLANEVPPTQ